MPLLSVCIPTYNRKPFLKETLDSIIPQITKDVEVVVSDNHSNDGTEEMLAEYAKTHKSFRYSSFPENMGADRNYLRVAELAHGKYIWFFSSDDVMESGALARMLSEIKQNPEVVIFQISRSTYTFDMSKKILSGADEIYLKDQVFRTLEEFMKGKRMTSLGYLSALLVRKSKWDEFSKEALKFVGTAYAHTFIAYSILKSGGIVKGISQALVRCRWGQDSFTDTQDTLESRQVKRLVLDIVGYDRISAAVFGKNSPMNRRVNDAVLNNLTFIGIFYAKMKGAGLFFVRKMLPVVFQTYRTYPSFWLKALPALLLPPFAAGIIYSARKNVLAKIMGKQGVILKTY